MISITQLMELRLTTANEPEHGWFDFPSTRTQSAMEAQRDKDHAILNATMRKTKKLEKDLEVQKTAAATATKKATDVVNKTVDNMSGSEAVGIATQKGMKEAGEAGGSLARKVGEFAGDHPMVAGAIAAGLGAKYLASRQRRNNVE
jgi:hypothetical protein